MRPGLLSMSELPHLAGVAFLVGLRRRAIPAQRPFLPPISARPQISKGLIQVKTARDGRLLPLIGKEVSCHQGSNTKLSDRACAGRFDARSRGSIGALAHQKGEQ